MKRGHRTPAGVSVLVKGKNVDVTAHLHHQVVHKMERLDKYLDRLQQIEVELCRENARDSMRKSHVEATTHVLGRTLRVQSDNADMMAAVDEAVDKMYRQLNRTKERAKSHHAEKFAGSIGDGDSAGPEEGDTVDDDEAPVVHVERIHLEPQFDEEAVETLEALGKDFYVFLNASSERINVVYRRPDGTYGLIEPATG